ncbi:Na+/H+ antiporter subunit E [Hydrocarboniclastica marina]|uniref:Cation transporter n=1 Tax=Hydrocarboniclastica marina TaxID=2259620 RepID=A0A4P7XCY7_9ALTE|nr:Na+/H+ antiporter subunit E [Hydrocarboniclastica marina]MAL98750.1 hypothetical protein [Alteromonadaceae bacterium]QCF24636.1 hypothetical protein soil367_00955 [Hydrocarboniclastica marina]|tara:strand:+ start:3059 stop:3571 length:513 start_codon:yes stop_codon:yes gene_type:complete
MWLTEDSGVIWLRAITVRALLAGAAWWIISEGQLAAVVVGLIAVAIAVCFSLYLAPPRSRQINPWKLVLFIGYFLARSLLAGFDVGRRILHPALPITPTFVRVPLALPADRSRWLLVQALSLVPGTLSVAIEEDELVLHCLNRDDAIDEHVRAMEARIGPIFWLPQRSQS